MWVFAGVIIRMIFFCPMVGEGNGIASWFIPFYVAGFRIPDYLIIVPTQRLGKGTIEEGRKDNGGGKKFHICCLVECSCISNLFLPMGKKYCAVL
mmetsp:Transcript_2860/g.4176  ORF Transcript_2860/g.4176 Transcript_2860/m.4176 type:complete len:95 (-) Transcript_2860:61-345(-)